MNVSFSSFPFNTFFSFSILTFTFPTYISIAIHPPQDMYMCIFVYSVHLLYTTHHTLCEHKKNKPWKKNRCFSIFLGTFHIYILICIYTYIYKIQSSLILVSQSQKHNNTTKTHQEYKRKKKKNHLHTHILTHPFNEIVSTHSNRQPEPCCRTMKMMMV